MSAQELQALRAKEELELLEFLKNSNKPQDQRVYELLTSSK